MSAPGLLSLQKCLLQRHRTGSRYMITKYLMVYLAVAAEYSGSPGGVTVIFLRPCCTPGAAAEPTVSNKWNVQSTQIQPIAFENESTFNSSAATIFSLLGCKISTRSNDLGKSTNLSQRLALMLQRLNPFFCKRVVLVIRTSNRSSCFDFSL